MIDKNLIEEKLNKNINLKDFNLFFSFYNELISYLDKENNDLNIELQYYQNTLENINDRYNSIFDNLDSIKTNHLKIYTTKLTNHNNKYNLLVKFKNNKYLEINSKLETYIKELSNTINITKNELNNKLYIEHNKYNYLINKEHIILNNKISIQGEIQEEIENDFNERIKIINERIKNHNINYNKEYLEITHPLKVEKEKNKLLLEEELNKINNIFSNEIKINNDYIRELNQTKKIRLEKFKNDEINKYNLINEKTTKKITEIQKKQFEIKQLFEEEKKKIELQLNNIKEEFEKKILNSFSSHEQETMQKKLYNELHNKTKKLKNTLNLKIKENDKLMDKINKEIILELKNKNLSIKKNKEAYSFIYQFEKISKELTVLEYDKKNILAKINRDNNIKKINLFYEEKNKELEYRIKQEVNKLKNSFDTQILHLENIKNKLILKKEKILIGKLLDITKYKAVTNLNLKYLDLKKSNTVYSFNKNLDNFNFILSKTINEKNKLMFFYNNYFKYNNKLLELEKNIITRRLKSNFKITMSKHNYIEKTELLKKISLINKTIIQETNFIIESLNKKYNHYYNLLTNNKNEIFLNFNQKNLDYYKEFFNLTKNISINELQNFDSLIISIFQKRIDFIFKEKYHDKIQTTKVKYDDEITYFEQKKDTLINELDYYKNKINNLSIEIKFLEIEIKELSKIIKKNKNKEFDINNKIKKLIYKKKNLLSNEKKLLIEEASINKRLNEVNTRISNLIKDKNKEILIINKKNYIDNKINNKFLNLFNYNNKIILEKMTSISKIFIDEINKENVDITKVINNYLNNFIKILNMKNNFYKIKMKKYLKLINSYFRYNNKILLKNFNKDKHENKYVRLVSRKIFNIPYYINCIKKNYYKFFIPKLSKKVYLKKDIISKNYNDPTIKEKWKTIISNYTFKLSSIDDNLKSIEKSLNKSFKEMDYNYKVFIKRNKQLNKYSINKNITNYIEEKNEHLEKLNVQIENLKQRIAVLKKKNQERFLDLKKG